MIKISFERIVVFDYLRLFQRKKTISAQAECVVMPHLLDLQVAVTDACRNFDSDSEEYDKHNAGDDPAEIYQIREFRQGDKMSRVHWKMTARLDYLFYIINCLPNFLYVLYILHVSSHSLSYASSACDSAS